MRWTAAILAPAAVALWIVLLQREATVPLEPADPAKPTLKVLTYNVNFGLEGDTDTLEAIARANADLVLLQETTPEWAQAIVARFRGSYPYIVALHAAGAGGQMVLGKRPLEIKETLDSPANWFPALRLIAETALGKVQVLNLHLHPAVAPIGGWVAGFFTTGPERLAEIAEYAKVLEEGLPTLFVGDFNESADGDAIRFLKARGARDAVSEHLGDEPTWRWPVGPLTLRLQLDHVLYQGGLKPVEVQVRPEGRSDHLPVVAVFQG